MSFAPPGLRLKNCVAGLKSMHGSRFLAQSELLFFSLTLVTRMMRRLTRLFDNNISLYSCIERSLCSTLAQVTLMLKHLHSPMI